MRLWKWLVICFASSTLVTAQTADPEALFVNGESILETELKRMLNSNGFAGLLEKPDFKGIDRADIEQYTLGQTVLFKIAEQEARDQDVTEAEVTDQVNNIISSQGSTNKEFIEQITTLGYTEESFYAYLKIQLQITKLIQTMRDTADVTPEELNFYKQVLAWKRQPSTELSAAYDAKELKFNGDVELWLRRLTRGAEVRDGTRSFHNPVVARVEGLEIRLEDLLRDIYTNPTIMNFIAQNQGLTQQFFKPQTLNNLIDRQIGVLTAERLGLPVIGSDSDVLQTVMAYQSSNIKVSEQEISTQYQKNKAFYTKPAMLDLYITRFAKRNNADAFRQALLKNQSIAQTAKRFSGQTETRLNLVPSDLMVRQIPSKLRKNRLGEVSQTTRLNSGAFAVYYVTNRRTARTQPLAEVRLQITAQMLTAKRNQASENWLQQARKAYRIENYLPEVQKELERRGDESATSQR